MINGLRHLLTNDATVAALVPAERIFNGFRSQLSETPAIVLDWVTTNDDYALGGSRCVSEYTVDILVYSKRYSELSAVMDAVTDLLESYTGTVTTSG